MSNKFKQNADIQNAKFNTDMIQVGIVKDNRDPQKMGRLKVWIEGSPSDKNNKNSWITCEYASPFAGRTQGTPNASSYDAFPKSYGFWAVPPDVEVRVFVFFVNGQTERAYWFGAAYDHGMNGMVPGTHAAVLNASGIASPVPVTEYDRNSAQSSTEPYINVPLTSSLQKQALLYDTQRGVPNRSARRQAPAQTYGLSSPRGNHICIDDGWTDDELSQPSWNDDTGFQNTEINNPVNNTTVGARKDEGIVLKTRSGAQLLISESDGNIFLINRDGTCRLEFDSAGHATVTANTISFRAVTDLNFTAGGNINMEAMSNINMISGGNNTTETAGYHAVTAGNDLLLTSNHQATLSGTPVVIDGTSNVSIIGAAVVIDGVTTITGKTGSPDFITNSGVSLSGHKHAQEPDSAGDTQAATNTPSPSGTAPSGTAGAVTTTTEIVKGSANDVVHIDVEASVQIPLTTDVGHEVSLSLSALGFSMPCTGRIADDGYWGEDFESLSGRTITNPGWIIEGASIVVGSYNGKVIAISETSIILLHENGYSTTYSNIVVDKTFQYGDIIVQNRQLGTVLNNKHWIFTVRKEGSSLTGFIGTVDPGLCFYEVTGKGENANGALLTQGVVTNTSKLSPVTNTSASTLVHTTTVSTISSFYPKSGSTYTPLSKGSQPITNKTKSVASVTAVELVGSPGPVDWAVQCGDAALIANLKAHEGPIPYQKAVKTFRNNKFYTYNDSRGKPTIGYGHLVLSGENFSAGLTEKQANALLDSDSCNAVNGAKSIAKTYKNPIPYDAQLVLVEMVFQLGKSKVLDFSDTLRELFNHNYDAAADGMLDSLWARQTPERAGQAAARMRALA